MSKWLIGVDEAGRGPLAGPVSVGVVKINADFCWRALPGVGDSKQLSEKTREEVYFLAKELKKENKIDYAVSLVHAPHIDKLGITKSVKVGIERCFRRLNLTPAECSVKLDGLLSAPTFFKEQETIIKGDQKELVIGLASILAKVTRDRFMVRKSLHPEFSVYQLEHHKGYGTQLHRELISKNGLSALHRRSYCKNLKVL